MVTSPVNISDLASTSAKNASVLSKIFQTVQAASCPGELNFHMHTHHSDGQLAPDELIEQAIKLGLSEFAITDHHSVNGYWQAKQCLEDWRWKHPTPVNTPSQRAQVKPLPRLWTGIEITSVLAETEVHLLGYGFDPGHEVVQPYLQGTAPKGRDQLAEQVIHAIHGAGGLVVLAHPCRYRRSAQDLVLAAVKLGIDGIETYYAYDNPQHWRPCPKQTPSMENLAAKYGLLSTCGTDTHGTVLTRRV
jgi:predicted metal-dependent phosphoesterase TrpH